jgi:hypothetical protein
MRTPVLLALAALLAVACTPDFERQSQIERVRVLAIQAEPAELALDPNLATLPPPVTFRVLAAAPEGRSVGVALALCRLTVGNPYGQGVECPGPDGVALPQGRLSVLDPSVQQVLLDAADAGTGGQPTDPSGPRVRQALERGIPVFIGYAASDGSGTPEGQERGVRQLKLRLTDAPNQNPRLEELLLGDAPLSGPLPLDTDVLLRPRLAEGSAERFTGPDGEQTEQVFYSWFATGEGEVKQLRSLEPVDGKPGNPSITYRTPKTPQRVTLYVVARDGRGGVDWLTRTVDVGP